MHIMTSGIRFISWMYIVSVCIISAFWICSQSQPIYHTIISTIYDIPPTALKIVIFYNIIDNICTYEHFFVII